jgi:hypothetical protein
MSDTVIKWNVSFIDVSRRDTADQYEGHDLALGALVSDPPAVMEKMTPLRGALHILNLTERMATSDGRGLLPPGARERLLAGRPKGLAGMVLERGRWTEPIALTDEERALVFFAIDRSGMRFPIQQCFRNSQRLALLSGLGGEPGEPDRLVYVEGYATSERIQGFPVMHGWLEINGKVIDLTWRCKRAPRGRLPDRAMGLYPQQREYVGVGFSPQQVKNFSLETGLYGSLLSMPWSGNPFMEERS